MKKYSSIFSLTGTAMITALSSLILYIATIAPTMRLALMCIAAALQCTCVIEFGRGYGFLAAISSSLIALLLTPNKQLAGAYICLFAAYPVLKSIFEIPEKRTVRLIFKCLYFIAASTVFSLLASKIIGLSMWIVFIGAFFAMIIIEFAFSAFISFYFAQITPKLKGFYTKQRR